jgi:hypothetical protein
MRKRKAGKRHTLMIYQRFMDRLWGPCLALGLALAAAWWQASLGRVPRLMPPLDGWAFVAALVTLAFTGFALLARKMSYVQARPDLLRLVTPFLRLNISYRRVRSVSASEFHKLYPRRQAGWGERRFLAPFYGNTAVVVDLFDFPLPPRLLRLFLPLQSFAPNHPGFVFMVADWMALSTEIDTRRAEWQAAQKPRATGLGLYR